MNTSKIMIAAALALNLAQTGCEKDPISASTCEPIDTVQARVSAKLVLGIPEKEVDFLIEIFPSQQITPLDSMPMATFKAFRGGPFTLDGKVFEELFKDYAPSSLANQGLDSISPFTVSVLQGENPFGWDEIGAILSLQYDSKRKRFENRMGSVIDTLPVLLQEIVAYEAKLTVPLPASQLHFMYLPGTHFYAALDSVGRCKILLPAGTYEGRLLSFESIFVKLAPVFSLSDSIRTDLDSVQSFEPAHILDSINVNVKELVYRYGKPLKPSP
jgi:hypothetical protein